MSDIVAYTLFSGSKGNAALIATKKSQILIDAGVSARSIESALNSLGTSLANISDIFITHDHSDHTRGLETICKKYDVKVHMTKGSAEVILSGALSHEMHEKAEIHELLYEYTTGDINVSSFKTPHDSHASVGYIIKACGHTIGYATDIGHITDTIRENLSLADSVIIEANHDVTMLKDGPYPEFLKARILSKYGHLSNEDCGALCAELSEVRAKRFLLAHLSEQNNAPEEAFFTVYRALGNAEKRGISLAVAEPDVPTKLI